MNAVGTVLLFGSLWGAFYLSGAKAREAEKNEGFAVVELFTSEGCSSCPPADRLIEKLSASNQDKQVYIMAYHVDYWDHQGWKDRFSSGDYSRRQHQYADWLRVQSLYTPQIVVNGSEEYVGSDEQSVTNAISRSLGNKSTDELVLNSRIEGTKINVSYQAKSKDQDANLVFALVQKKAQSDVRAGENTGRKLSHVQIVRKLDQVKISDEGKATIPLPEDFKGNDWELIGFVQKTANGQITAAAKSAL
jgi:hypothetical protein